MRSAILAAAAALMLPSLALAQMPPGGYASMSGGINLTNDSDITGTGINLTADFDNGWGLAGAVGYKYPSGLRLEGEISFRDNEVDSVSGVTTGSGDVSSFGFMANVLYDFGNGKIVPYIGAGIGLAHVSFDAISPVGGSVVDDSDTVFAYQGIAGLAVPLNDLVALSLDYRYFATADPDTTTDSGTNVEGEYKNHTIMVGLRFSFGAPRPVPKPMAQPMPAPKPMAKPKPAPAPPPPPMAAPMPAPKPMTRSFLVFFDWDKSNITPEANNVLRQAAANARSAKVTRITLTGHADRSGSKRYNMRLSLRRANNVKRTLRGLGVPEKNMAVIGRGETQPLVPTSDGVREAQNRRVEIVF
ncbi:MAG: outer membrane beta-barrel protein [Alphaproteobacteria bacterium]